MNRDLTVALRITADGKVALANIDQVKGRLNELDKSAAASGEAARKAGQGWSVMNDQLYNLKAHLTATVGLVALTNAAISQARAVYQTTAQFERYQRSLAFAAGSQGLARAEMEFARQTAIRLGLQLEGTVAGYAKMSAASQGTAIDNRVLRETFLGVAQASAVLGLSGDQVRLTLNAINQMVSKGTVMQEELRQQLAEHLPGAMNIAARAMGMTQRELSDLMERGELYTSTFLPKFAAELQRTFGPGSEQAANSLTAATNRLQTAWTDLQLKVGESGFAETAARAMTRLAEGLQAVRPEDVKRVADLMEAVRGAFTNLASGRLLLDVATGQYLRPGSPASGDTGLADEIRVRIASIPERGAAQTAEQNAELERARALMEQLLGQVERRELLEAQVKKRIEEANGAIERAMQRRSEMENRALIRQSEGEGYYRSPAVLSEVANDALRAWERSLPESVRLLNQYHEAVGAIRIARDQGVIAANKAAEAEKNLQNALLASLNVAGVRLREAVADGARARAQARRAAIADEIEAEEAALKARLEAGFVTEAAAAERSYALKARLRAADREAAEAELAIQRQLNEDWERALGRFLPAEQAAIRRAENANKVAAIEERIASIRRKDAVDEAARAAARYQAARAEWEVVNEIEDASRRYVESVRAQAEETAFELSLLGQSERVQRERVALRKIDQALQVELNRLIAEENRLREAGKLTQEAQQAIEQARTAAVAAAASQRELTAAAIESRSAFEALGRTVDGFLDAAMRGGRALKDWFKRELFEWLKAQVLRPFVFQIVGLPSVSGGAPAGNLFSVLGSVLSGQAGASGGMAGTLLGGLSSLGNMMGFGGLASVLGTMPFVAGAGPIAAGTGLAGMLGGALGGAVASFASFLPMLGPLVVLAPLLGKLFKNKDGLWFDFWGEGQSPYRAMNPGTGIIQTALGTIAAQGEVNLQRDAPTVVATFQQLASGFAQAFGETLTAQARANIGRWTGFSERGRGTEYENAEQYAAALRTESKDVMAEFFGRAFAPVSARISQEILAWAGSADELAQYIREVLNAQTALTQQGPALRGILGEALGLERLLDLRREGESLSETLGRVVGAFALTNQVAEWLGKGADAFGEVGLASLAARERLIELAGGTQALASGLQQYLQEFFTEEERALREREIATRQVNAVFAELGLAVPASREAFRALVESIDLSTEEGQRLFAALIKVAPAFAGMTREIEQTAQALRDISREEREFLELYYSDQERAALRAAEAMAEVVSTFASLGIAIPQSREAFRELVESIDRSTPAGEALYRALILVARAFFDATQATQAAAAAVNDYYAVIGQVIAESGNEMQRRISAVFGLIDSASDSWTVRLANRRAWIEGQLANGALFGPERAALENALADTLRLIGVLERAGQAAPGFADAMFEVQRWYEEQVALAAGNAQLLLLIEAEYQRRRQEVLTSGATSGLNSLAATIRAWLNNLMLDDRLTTLTPAQRLAEAERQYQLALAGGDGSAITRAAEAYLAEARNMYASGSQYQQIFNAIVAQLSAIAGGAALPVVGAPGPGAPVNGGLTGGTVGAVVGATQALTSATNELLTSIAQATAATRNAVESQAQLDRQHRSAQTDRLIAARALMPQAV